MQGSILIVTVDPLTHEILETAKDHPDHKNDIWRRRQRLAAVLRGEVQLTEQKSWNTAARRKTTGRRVMMNQHSILLAIRTANDRVLDTSGRANQNMKKGYYTQVLAFAHKCMDEGLGKVVGLPCHWQNCPINGGIIAEDTAAFSVSKRNGHKYYHMECAERINLI